MHENAHRPAAPQLVAQPGARALIQRFARDWIWPRRSELAVVLMLTAGLAAATGGYPLIIKQSFDSLLANATGVLPLVLAAIVVVTLARSILMYFHNVVGNRMLMRLTRAIQKRIFDRLMDADFARLTREAPGQMMSRVTNDVVFIQTGVQAALNTAIKDVLSVAVLVATMFYLDWVMSCVVLGVYPIAVLPIIVLSRRLRSVATRTQTGLGDMTALLGEMLSSARLIKTYRLERYASARVAASLDHVLALQIKALRNRARVDPLLEGLGGIAVAGVVALAYWRIASGESTVGDFMGFVSALLMAAQPIRGLGTLSARVQEAIAAMERVYGLIDEPTSVADRSGATALTVSAGEIRFEHVSFAYEPEAPAVLRDIALTVPGGAIVALVGRSGSGKSTLVNLVPRLFDPTAGRILIDGQDIRDVTLASLRDAIAVVSQDVTLFDDTIRNNIALGRPDASDDDIVHAATAAAAAEFIATQPDGYDTRIGDRGARLSGGQRQRVALARAILRDSPILLLDEATSALDTRSEHLVQAALAEFSRGRTTLVIAHRLSTVQNADLICVIEDGAIVETGRHGELIANGGIYADLCRLQLIEAPAEAIVPSPPEAPAA